MGFSARLQVLAGRAFPSGAIAFRAIASRAIAQPVAGSCILGTYRLKSGACSLLPLCIFGVGTALCTRDACVTACDGQRNDFQKASARTVELTVTRTPSQSKKLDGPVIVFAHGLDSWRGTWRRPVEELARHGRISISVDQRGHGESPLGAPEDFGPSQLAADVRAAIRSAGLLEGSARVALVGHSMGGLVAMRYAADYPQDLAALVIEDIDCVPWGEPPPSAENLKRMQHFDRHFHSWEACLTDLKSYGYEEKRMMGWRQENPPRVFDHPEGGVWSAINPHAQHLATVTVGNSNNGLESLSRLAAARASGKADFPVHLFVAGKGYCDWNAFPGGVHDMGSVLPGLMVREFPAAYHSIHNTAMEAFVDSIETILGGLPKK